jgi:ATP-dependent Clp protease adaptor protein ClpS
MVEILSKNKSEDFESNNSSLLELEEPKLKKPSLYRVILLNDNYTPMEFVIYVLQTFFSYDKEKATQIMLAVHTKGKGVCGVYTKEVAETKSNQINSFAKQNEHPLVSDIEPIDED